MWNTQALFAADPSKHELKYRYVANLMARYDIAVEIHFHRTLRAHLER